MEQHDAFVPGTIHLVDLDGTSSAQHSSTGQKDIILVPAPSSDPDDPLNWSFRRKTLLTSCLCMYTLMVGIGETAISSVLIPISMRSGLSLNDLNAGTGYMYLLLGWGCLFWQPLALQYGKRPVYLISIFAQIGLMVWAPYTKSNGEWIANKILQGFFGAPIEALCESSVTDVYFTHQRGLYLSIYALFVVSGGYCAPVMAGFITDGQSWEWVLYWAAIFNAIGFVYLFFFMEETNYSRQVIAGREESTSDIRYPDGQHEASKAPPREDCKNISDSVSSTEEGQQTIQLPKKRYLQKLRLFEPGTFSKPVLLKGMFLRPLIYLSFPVIAWPGFCYGTGLIWFNLLNGTSSLIFSGPPYGFAPSMVGLTYLSPVIGGILGAIFCGKFGNWFVLKLARRNRGVMEPENRLWLFSFPLLLYPFGLILYGVGAAYGVHWFGLVGICTGLV